MADDPVRSQYEAYPYPVRDPADERRRLIVGSPSHLDELNHHVFGGKMDFTRPWRMLAAGGGTGDAAIMMAQQLADRAPASEVLYIDIADGARRIAEARAQARGLRNIRFRRLSLLELDPAEVGRFDYIDCCGVLHHLADPAAGLRALTGVLADDGGLGLMLYAPHGRDGVYPMQAMLRTVAAHGAITDDRRLDITRRLLRQLPDTHPLKRNPFLRDHLEQGDAGLYDLFLHARDRPFTVPETLALCHDAALRVTTFIEPAFYDPLTFLADPILRTRVQALSREDRWAFAERLAGAMRKHVFYAVRAANPVTPPAPDDPAAVPVLRDVDGPAVARQLQPGVALTVGFEGISLRLPLPPLAGAILRRIDGRRSLAEIGAGFAAEPDVFFRQFGQLHATLNGIGKLYLARPPVPLPPH
ncbi:MAG: class I SAM-dependent methyltransferase [Rhodospirillales bacterium]|nr:MAG: class I SAM-dependent methyltransferase [Rhodospirillales bacterium]